MTRVLVARKEETTKEVQAMKVKKESFILIFGMILSIATLIGFKTGHFYLHGLCNCLSGKLFEYGIPLFGFLSVIFLTNKGIITIIKNFIAYRFRGLEEGTLVFFNYENNVDRYDADIVRGLVGHVGSLYSISIKQKENIMLQYTVMMKLADVYDALVSKRVYKESFNQEKAESIIREGIGSHFDSDICIVLMEYRKKFIEIRDSFQ